MPQNSPQKRRSGFSRHSLYPMAQPSFPALKYMKQKSSFWIAALSLIAFVSGNMMGQHGFHAFWAAVLGAGDDSMIVYEGVIAPVAKIPDYTKWAKYGGSAESHTFREVPQDALVNLPPYSALGRNDGSTESRLAHQAYIVDHAGDYDSGDLDSGAHDGIDIDVPTGTPILAVGNGRIYKVADDASGFGLYITLKLPNVPDPKDPKKTTDLYCTTGHMSAQLVVTDQIVRKGDVIGYSGKTGFATGPHVHFQCDDKSAPFIPYSPFTGSELRDAKISFVQAINSAFHQDRIFTYSVNPMAYVTANYPTVKGQSNGQTIVMADPSLMMDRPTVSPAKRAVLARAERVNRRLSQRRVILGDSITVQPGPSALVTTGLIPVTLPPVQSSAAVSSTAPSTTSASSVSVSSEISVFSSSSASSVATQAAATEVARIELTVPESFQGRAWVTVRVTLLDADGKRVTRPILKNDIVLHAAYGTVEIRPQTLSTLDFKDGVATAKVLPRGTRTVVMEAMAPWNVLSRPIAYGD